jgi:hypothetical protein
MFQPNTKLQIYKGIIQYLLESTNYNLKNIAELSNSSLEHIRSIHFQNMVPDDFFSESQLVKLYQIILDIHPKKNRRSKYIVEINQIVE